MLINNIIPKINSNIKMKIKKEKENYFRLQDNELCNVSSSTFVIKGYITLKYYYNFIIISPETMDLLMKDFSFQYGKNLILFGDNKVFIKRKKQLLIEICFINNKNIFVPELFFYFGKKSILNNNLNLLQNEGYEQYFQYNLLFNNDYASPIFDKNNDNIGYAFKYEPSIKDYSIYQINEQLKAMIKIYFSKVLIKNKLDDKELLEGKYFIIDTKYMQKIKELFDYNNLEKELNNNAITKQVMNLLEKSNSKIENNILNEKKISLIIKCLPDEINTNYNKREFNNKIECQEVPNLISFNNGNLFYYNNFEIVDKSIYDLLFKLNSSSSLYEEKNNYFQCIFIEKYILINISNNGKCIIEVCIINDNNNINPLYILEYDNGDNFLKHIKYVKTIFGVQNFFESLDFTFNNKIQMNDENDKEIGFIYNLGIKDNANISSLSNNDSKVLIQIYILCKEYYNYEKLMNNGTKNNDYDGFLIEKNKIENLKNKIHYDKLKNDIDSSFENIKDKIANLGESKEIERNITQTKFNNSEDLIESLKKNKKYYLINKSLWINICRLENKEEKGVIFSFSGNNILLSLNENENKILHFKINGGIIEKSSIVINRNQFLFLKNYKINENIKKSLLKTNIDNIYFDSMCCLNCKSQIEIRLIKFNGYNKEDSIIYYCKDSCGNIDISIKEYFEKLLFNIYLSVECSICKNLQIKTKNIFDYCVNCEKIFCNDCLNKNSCKNYKYIKINESDTKCLFHNNEFACFCLFDEMNLCEECLNEGTHLEHFKINLNEISPIQIKNKEEEIEIFKNVINYFKEKIIDIKEEKKQKCKDLFDKNKSDIKTNYENKKDQISSNEQNELNKIESNFKSIEKRLKESLDNDLKEKAKNVKKKLLSLINDLDNKIINNSDINNLSTKYDSFTNFFDNIKCEITNKYEREIIKIKDKCESSIKDNQKTYDNEIKKIKEKYKNLMKGVQNKYDSDIKELNQNYQKSLKNIEKSKDDCIVNSYENQIKLGETIYNTFKLHKANYFNVKNMYNLMINYYNNEEIYNNVVLKVVNNSKNKENLLKLIEKKKNKFDKSLI